MSATVRTALVIGANGGFGHAAAQALLGHGWKVRALTRSPPRDARLEWVRGDAFEATDVTAAAAGVQVIVQGANPPGYRDWGRQLPAMAQAAIAGARATGARLVYPASVYNYDPRRTPVIREETPQSPPTPKGRLRSALEARLRAEAEAGLKVLIVRAGDFFGPPPVNGWLSGGMVRPGRPLRAVVYPGRPDVGHAFAYLPDLAETVARLLDQADRLGHFELFHFGGHWLERGIEMAEAVRRASGDPGLPIRPFPWLLARLASPASPMLRGIVELRYLWRLPLRLDNARLVAFLGEEPHTPLDLAVRRSLKGLGCLPAAEGAARAEPMRAAA